MKIYLAANFAAKEKMREFFNKLNLINHLVTSSWIDCNYDTEKETPDKEQAIIDNLKNLEESDCLILFVDQLGKIPGRGKYIEFGYALAIGMTIYVVGQDSEESIFFFHPFVMRFGTEEALLQ